MNKALAQKTPLAPGKIESNHHFPSLHPIKLISLNSTLNICENMFIFIVINRLSNKNTTIENWSTHWRQTVSWLVVRIVSLISLSHTLPKPRNTWSGEEEAGGETLHYNIQRSYCTDRAEMPERGCPPGDRSRFYPSAVPPRYMSI